MIRPGSDGKSARKAPDATEQRLPGADKGGPAARVIAKTPPGRADPEPTRAKLALAEDVEGVELGLGRGVGQQVDGRSLEHHPGRCEPRTPTADKGLALAAATSRLGLGMLAGKGSVALGDADAELGRPARGASLGDLADATEDRAAEQRRRARGDGKRPRRRGKAGRSKNR